MATKPKQPEVIRPTEVVPHQPKTSVALPAEWATELAQAAKDESAKETPSIQNISFRSGVLSVGGQPIPGNTMTQIVVGTAYERSLYDGPFDPNKIKNPVCFALSIDGEEMAPHANSLHPQNETCKGCPMDDWGSAGEGRRGKACKEMRRLAVIPADKLESVDDIKNSELAMAKIPVTSVSNWSNYVHKVGAMLNVPFWAVITRMTVKPHIKNQFEVLFDLEDPVDDVDALTALKAKKAHVEPFVMAPYSMASEEAENVHPHTTQAPAKPAVKRKF